MPHPPPFAAQASRPDAAIRLWPDPACARRCPHHGSHQWWPRIHPGDLLLSEGSDSEVWADISGWTPRLSTLLGQVPGNVDATLSGVPAEHWLRGLRAAHDCPDLLDLFATDSVLATLLGWRVAGDDEATAMLRDRLGGRRRDLLPVLDLPASRWMLQTMQRVDLFALDFGGAERLLRALASGSKKVRNILRHAPRISAASLRLLDDEDLLRHAAPSLLLTADTDGVDHHLRQLVELREAGEVPTTPRLIRTRALLDALLDHQEEVPVPAFVEAADMPEPPFGDLTLVVAGQPPISVHVIQTLEEAQRVGAEMGLCLADEPEVGYWDAVERGVGLLLLLHWVDDSFLLTGLRRRGVAFLRLSGCWTVTELEAKSGMAVPRWVADRLDDLAWFSDLPPWYREELEAAEEASGPRVLDPAAGAAGLLVSHLLPE